MELIQHWVIEACLVGVVIFSEMRNYFERRTLLDRLMAKDLAEYSAFQSEGKKVNIPDEKPREQFITL
jgi:hypothetical protein